MMRWRVLVLLATTGLVVLLTARPALAKGPDQATITGPGLAQPIVVGGQGEPGGGDRLAELADGSGLFRVMFGPDAGGGGGTLITEQPAGSLGPQYTLSYRVPTDVNAAVTVRQDLYPSAPGGPLTYTAAGQETFTGTQTSAGWYRAPASFTSLLARLGVPAGGRGVPGSPTATTGSAATTTHPAGALDPVDRRPAVLVAMAAVLGCGLLTGGVIMHRRRGNRRYGPQPAVGLPHASSGVHEDG